jgi:hypothetical protein
MNTLIIYDKILILHYYGMLEIPCLIPLFGIALPNPRKKTTENSGFPCP